MKKIYFLAILLAFTITSCKKSFIDLTPQDQISEANFYQTEAQFRQALASTYVTLRAVFNQDFYESEMRSDNTDYDYYPVNVGTAYVYREYIHDWVDDASDSYTDDMYRYFYVGVARCNTIIGRLPAATGISASVRSEIQGEAEFLRAFYYFRLVRYFGGVPLPLTEVTTADQAFIPRSSADAVYKQIVADASDAITKLPVVAFAKGQQTGAATKGAATMLLADVYMTQKNYAGAEALLTTLSGMGYSLLPSYASVFSTANKNSVESIFEVQYMAGAAGGQQSNFIYLFLPRTTDTKLITSGVTTNNTTTGGWNVPTQDLINAYEPGDTRLDASIGVAEGTYNSSDVMTISAYKSIVNYAPAAGKVGRFFDKKVLNPVTVANNTDDDWPVYRYADALLLLAEAQNEQGKGGMALTSLNQVRTRAFGNASHNITITDQTALRTAIAHERRVELAFENHRWFDLLRTGTALSVMSAFATQIKQLHPYLAPNAYNIQAYRLLYPIPFSQIGLNTQLTQNPGYTF
jgi:starch-binding outer membrane protein, SusD/RagB family